MCSDNSAIAASSKHVTDFTEFADVWRSVGLPSFLSLLLLLPTEAKVELHSPFHHLPHRPLVFTSASIAGQNSSEIHSFSGLPLFFMILLAFLLESHHQGLTFQIYDTGGLIRGPVAATGFTLEITVGMATIVAFAPVAFALEVFHESLLFKGSLFWYVCRADSKLLHYLSDDGIDIHLIHTLSPSFCHGAHFASFALIKFCPFGSCSPLLKRTNCDVIHIHYTYSIAAVCFVMSWRVMH